MTAAHVKKRDSSIETFRILATFLVLIVHFNGWFVGGITDPFDSEKDFSFRMGQMLISSLSVVCVNCFLIISGWYGVKFKLRSIWNIYILLVCIYVPFQLISSIYTGNFSIFQLINNLLAFTRESYFVQCYLMLIFLSPIINSFIEKYGHKILSFVIVFWLIEIVMENLIDNKCLGFEDGYSLIHFILIYMLARTASIYKNKLLEVRRKKWIIGYFTCALLVCIGHILGFKHNWDYSNPIVVIESFCLFFIFIYKPFYNKKINWLAKSTFAVYIIHISSPVYNILVRVDNWLLGSLNYYAYVPSFIFVCVIIFFIGILYDKSREFLLSQLTDKLFNIINVKLKRFFIYE